MNWICLFVFCLSFFANTPLVAQKKVLLLGNSLTYFNSMPKTLQELFNENRDSVEVDCLAFPGYSLRSHLDNYHYGKKSINFVKMHRYKELGYDMNRIQKSHKYSCDIDTIHKSSLQLILESNIYDYIIIQEHGNMIASNEFLQYIATKSLKRLKVLLKHTNNDSAKIIYFTENPSRKLYRGPTNSQLISLGYDTITCEQIMPNDSSKLTFYNSILQGFSNGMISPIEDINHYEKNLEKLKTIVPFKISPSARIFNLLKEKHPNWKMLRIGGHPSQKTSLMLACVYYEMITGKSAETTTFHWKVRPKIAKQVKKEVHNFLLSY